ncbi:hypothetical protein [Mycobacterium malmoense]|uniref:hypothetical protein n=1 Tax=Mycobacterium malmoense TaxID=1780 RepID=UPI00080B5415|nr:hypothetical protein [Mycobacterium malmoense]
MTFPNQSLRECGGDLLEAIQAVIHGADRSLITQAAVKVWDAAAHADENDPLASLADTLAEKASLWAYFDRLDDLQALKFAHRAYTMVDALYY